MIKPFANLWIRLLFFLKSFQKNKQIDKTTVKNILFAELSRMGDLISILPAVNRIKAHFSDAKLCFAINKNYSGIIEAFFPDAVVFKFENSDTIRGLISGMKLMKKFHFDLICSMSQSYRNAYVSLRLNSPYKVGFFESYSSYTPFLHRNHIKTIGFSNSSSELIYNENIINRGIKICKLLGIKDYKDELQKQTTLSYTKNILQENSYTPPYILVHPFSGWEFRNWKLENYANLIDELYDEYKIPIIVIGSKEEKAFGDSLSLLVNYSDKIKLTFGSELKMLIQIISRAVLFIGNDSGPLHLASALGIPSIGLFGPAPPELTAPHSNRNIHIHKKVECCPCDQITCIRPDDPCINLISVAEVLNQTKILISDLKARKNK